MNFDKLIACFDADWDESKHPRAKNGQFGKKGSGGSTSTGSKEKKKSTMSKSYKALSSGQKADAKAHVASQIKSMSKEKQISVANRVLKAQGKELIVANKDGTYTWTNKGERVTTQKPPRIKSDKLARAIVSNGYAVPGIKTGVSAETAKASSSKPSNGGGITSEQLAAARRLSSKMNGSGKDDRHQKFLKLSNKQLKPKDKDKIIKQLGDAEYYLRSRYHEEGKKLSSADVMNASNMLSSALRQPGIDTLSKAIGIVYTARRHGARLGNMAAELVRELANR